MALKTTVPGHGPTFYSDSFVADGALASRKNTMVVFSAQATGKPKVAVPGGQGVISAGVLVNNDDVANGGLAEVQMLGVAKVKANGTFNAGIEVTIAANTGKIEAAGAEDYVIGVSLEGAAEANQLVAVLLGTPYQKNA
jgi:hypothetical protein